MNKTPFITLMLVLSMIFVILSGEAVDVLRPEQRHFANNFRYLVKRDTTTIPGSVILYWNRGGKPDWIKPSVETQKIENITGKQVFNPLQRMYVTATNHVVVMSNRWVVARKNYDTMSNRWALAHNDYSSMSNKYETIRLQFEKLKTQNEEASSELDEVSTKYPLLQKLIEKIKAKLKLE